MHVWQPELLSVCYVVYALGNLVFWKILQINFGPIYCFKKKRHARFETFQIHEILHEENPATFTILSHFFMRELSFCNFLYASHVQYFSLVSAQTHGNIE